MNLVRKASTLSFLILSVSFYAKAGTDYWHSERSFSRSEESRIPETRDSSLPLRKTNWAGISPTNLALLNSYQDTLKGLSDSIVQGSQHVVRQNACYDFIKTLVRALKVEGSFDFPFDSLNRIMIIKSPDNKFRVFNWCLEMYDGTFRYYGAIQTNNSKKLTIFPLYDYSYRIVNTDTITSNEKWLGALYYKMLKKGKFYYLFGWQGNNLQSSKKLVEVLSFNKEGKPIFGAPKFLLTGGSKKTSNRFIIEFKKGPAVTLNYDEYLNKIVYDHLVPPDEKSKGFYFLYIPDGTYEGFAYKGGKWVHIDEVFTSKMSKPIFPKPMDFDKVGQQR